MSAGSESRPAVVYIDDDGSARAAFERAFQGEHLIFTTSASALAQLDLPHVAVFVLDAVAIGSIGEAGLAQFAELHRQAMRVVITKPWQKDALGQLIATACAAWSRSTAHARTLSHDLRTPLMSLLADAEHLSALAEQQATLRDVAENMLRAARLVRQLVERLEL